MSPFLLVGLHLEKIKISPTKKGFEPNDRFIGLNGQILLPNR